MKRSYRRKVKNNQEVRQKFWEAFRLFSKDPFAPRLRTDKLSGRLKGLWAFTVSCDCRVIFKYVGKEEVLLVDIGTIMNYISPLSNDDDLRISLRLRTLDLGLQKEDFALPTLDIWT